MPKVPPSLISLLLAGGTALIGALLAYQYSSQATVEPAQAKTLLYAFGLTALFVVASLLFAKGEAQKKEVA